MVDENKKAKTRWQRLKDTYRLVVMNDETFQEVGSYKLSLLNVYVALSTLVVLVAIFVVLLIAYTPAGRLLPGYHYGGSNNSELLQLYHELDSLEQLTQAQDRYNESFRRLLVGEVQGEPASPPKTQQPSESSTPPVERVEEDELLRQEVELSEVRTVTGKAKSNSPINISPRDIPLEQMYFTPPIGGTISAQFDPEKKHFGVDVIAPKNTPVKAAMDGWVITSDWTLETGNTIAVQHTNNIVTFYKHNSVLLKKTGNYVRAGEAIAIIGNTGELTDGPHLHFELWHRGKPVNPLDFVTFK
jgi:murein DD-endopeptidase MepM/ murein hydrolase activator NlpD